MKKVLSIVLSLAMVICLMPAMAFGATVSTSGATYADTAGTKCEGAVNVLSALGMVNGYEDGTYKPEQTVTRAEMAKLVITALGVADYATATVSQFNDMSAANWAIPFVEYAANLNIVNGYGDGRFGPSDTVTYEQAVTMIVRALGYTDKCNEMNGSWPAIYVQKAMALGIFNDVANGGASGANRGDIALMLYNSLNVPQVYANQDGTTEYKQGNGTEIDGKKTATIMSTLNKDGTKEYTLIRMSDADTALVDIFKYVGMVAEVTKKGGEILAVGDIKSTIMTGDLSEDGKTFESGGTKYDSSGVNFVTIADDTGLITSNKKDANAVRWVSPYTTINSGTTNNIVNNPTANATWGVRNVLSNIASYNNSGVDQTAYFKPGKIENLDLSVKVSGTTIKEVYAANIWTTENCDLIGQSDIDGITNNQKLFGRTFKKDDSQEIDTKSFDLRGVNSLSDIQPDNVVYVYTRDDNSNSNISRVDVGTEIVYGKVTKVETKDSGALDKLTIDGTTYKIAGKKNQNVPTTVESGDEVKVWLDYNNKIFKLTFEDAASSSNYALVTSKGTAPTPNSAASYGRIQLVTSDGRSAVYDIDGVKFNNGKSDPWNNISEGDIVKYSLNDNNVITRLYVAGSKNGAGYNAYNSADDFSTATLAIDGRTYAHKANDSKITKAGYIDGFKIAENAVVYAAPYDKSVGDGKSALKFNDADNISVVRRDDVLDSDAKLATLILNDKNQVVAMVMYDGAVSKKQYGIVTSAYTINDNKEAMSMFIGTDEVGEALFDDGGDITNARAVVTNNKAATGSSFYLYKVNKTATDKYKLDNIAYAASCISNSSGAAVVRVDDGNLKSDVNGVKINQNTSVTSLSAFSLYSDAVIYVYDKSDNKFMLGSRADMFDSDNVCIYFYMTEPENGDKSKDNCGLIDYVTVFRK